MRALILAAGRGTRLGLHDGEPKCLARVGGRTLLDGYLDPLARHGVPVTIVVGHGAERIAAHVGARTSRQAGALSTTRSATRGAPPTLVHNPRFAEGSILSLATGLDALGPLHDDLLLFDGDVAFDPRLLEQLVRSGGSALLVDVGVRFTDEQYMAGIRGGRIAALQRGPADGFDAQGEWIGFARLDAAHAGALHAGVHRRIAAGATTGGYEDELAALCIESGDVSATPTDGLAWTEVDFPDDLARARSLFPSPTP